MFDFHVRYANRQLVGKGSFGEVYSATDTRLSRRVALKQYYRGRTDAVRASIALWSKLNHPNIAQVIDCFEWSGDLYLVMTYCEQGPLDRHLVELRQNPSKLANWFSSIVDAVHLIHSRGLIARDLKISNVMVDGLNHPVLIDLDRCVAAGAPSEAEQVGTLGYMAPELMLPGAKSSFQTDQYALGVILYQMLNDRIADKQASAGRLGGLPELQSFQLGANVWRYRDWNAIIAKATNSQASERYTTLTKFADDVRHLAAGMPIQARRTSRLERAVRWIRRRPRTAGLAFSIVLAIFAGLALLYLAESSATYARLKVHANTELVSQRIREANIRKDELEGLVSSVEAELRLAEAAENDQRIATRAAETAQQRTEKQAEYATKLTAELEKLVRQKTESGLLVEMEKAKNQEALSQLATTKEKQEALDYATKLAEVWSQVVAQSWEKAQSQLDSLKSGEGQFEYNLIASAINNRLVTPEMVEIGRKTGNEIQFAFNGQCNVIATVNKQLATTLRIGVSTNGRSSKVFIDIDCAKLPTIELRPSMIAEKLSGLSILRDGSVLFSTPNGRLLVLTFAPKNYRTTKNEVKSRLQTQIFNSDELPTTVDTFARDREVPRGDMPAESDRSQLNIAALDALGTPDPALYRPILDLNTESRAQAQRENSLQEIARCEKELKALPPGTFVWSLHNDLRHHYFRIDESKSYEHVDIMFKNRPFDSFTLSCLVPSDAVNAAWVAQLIRIAQKYPQYKYLHATCWALAGKHSKTSTERARYFKAAVSDSSLDVKFRDSVTEFIKKANQASTVTTK